MYMEKYSSKSNNNSDNKTFSICVRSDAGWHIIQPFHSNVYAFVCLIQIFCENRESRFFCMKMKYHQWVILVLERDLLYIFLWCMEPPILHSNFRPSNLQFSIPVCWYFLLIPFLKTPVYDISIDKELNWINIRSVSHNKGTYSRLVFPQ